MGAARLSEFCVVRGKSRGGNQGFPQLIPKLTGEPDKLERYTDMTSIYALVESDGTVLYVGKTVSPKKREKDHRGSQRRYYEEGIGGRCGSCYIPLECEYSMNILEVVEDTVASQREAYFIRKLRPIYNKIKMDKCLYSKDVWTPIGNGQYVVR